MKSLLLLVAVCLTLISASSVFAAETTLTDNDGSTAWLDTPSEKPDAAKTYWLVVGGHGVGANGQGACGAAYLAKEFDDVTVLGPSFGQPKRDKDAPRPPGMPRDSYQMSGPTHEAKLAALIAEVGRTWKLHPKIVVHGFSAGAQFANRFALKHPEQVAGVSAHSGGSWARLEGDDKINPAAKGILFAVSCGEDDKGSGGPPATPSRIEGAKQFAENLQSLGFSVELQTWPGVAHDFAPGLMPMAKALVEKVRGGALVALPPLPPQHHRVHYEPSAQPGELVFGVSYTVWIPPGVRELRGVIVHQHGRGDGACKAGQTAAFDLHWQALARQHG